MLHEPMPVKAAIHVAAALDLLHLADAALKEIFDEAEEDLADEVLVWQACCGLYEEILAGCVLGCRKELRPECHVAVIEHVVNCESNASRAAVAARMAGLWILESAEFCETPWRGRCIAASQALDAVAEAIAAELVKPPRPGGLWFGVN